MIIITHKVKKITILIWKVGHSEKFVYQPETDKIIDEIMDKIMGKNIFLD